METSVSLLERLCDPSDKAAWRRLDDLYLPLVAENRLKAGLQPKVIEKARGFQKPYTLKGVWGLTLTSFLSRHGHAHLLQ